MTSQLIVALDFDNQKDAFKLIDKLEPQNCALKVGSEMFTLFGTHFVKQLIDKQFKIFLDLKFHDIPNTVAKACIAGAELGVWMMNVHASGGLSMMQAAKKSLEPFGKDRPLLIAVTVLTSFDQTELAHIGIKSSIMDQVSNLACLAKKADLDGVVCSAHEVGTIKEACGNQFITVTPGIRLASNTKDDQSRIMTPEEAIKQGSDYLVIGRPITQSLDPALVIGDILRSIHP